MYVKYPRNPPVIPVISWFIPIVVKNISGRDIVLINIFTIKYKNPVFNIHAVKIPKALPWNLLIIKEYIALEIMIKGIRYTRNIVKLLNSIPLKYDIHEGSIKKGIVFLKPNFSVEYTKTALTIVPTRY